MNIFSSKTNYIEFFIKVGKKCPTNCTNCSYANSDLDYFNIDNIFERINYGQNLFDGKDFVYFLYGVDILLHPDIEKILDFVSSKNRKFKIQIGLSDLESKKVILNELYDKYGFFEITVANEINTKDDVKKVLNALSFFSSIKKLRFNFDIIIDISKNKIFIDKLKGLFGDYHIDKVHKNLTFDDIGNINLGITDKFYIDPQLKSVMNIGYEKCIMDDLFEIKDNIIYFNDHLEIDYDGNLMLHTPLCFLAYIKIAHKTDSENIILEKFKNFKNSVGKIDKNMGKKCFECIRTNGLSCYEGDSN